MISSSVLQQKSAAVALSALVTLLALVPPTAAQISQVPPESLTGDQIVDFENFSPPREGTNLDDIFITGGVAFAERFRGQQVTYDGNFDVLSGSPTSLLTLAIGVPNENLTLKDKFPFFDTKAIDGNGSRGYSFGNAIGEGSIALIFSSDQSEFGVLIGGGHGGDAQIEFFRRDGVLIDSIRITDITNTDIGFIRDGGIKDIAGVSIWNNDPGGVFFDDFRFNVKSTIPEPNTICLWCVALMTCSAVFRVQAGWRRFA